MSNPNKKLRRKQANLEFSRREVNGLVERFSQRIRDNEQIFNECGGIKIEEPLDPKVFERLMVLRLEELEWDKWEFGKLLEKQKILNSTPNFL